MGFKAGINKHKQKLLYLAKCEVLPHAMWPFWTGTQVGSVQYGVVEITQREQRPLF